MSRYLSKNMAELSFKLRASDIRAPLSARMLGLHDQCLTRIITRERKHKKKNMDKGGEQRSEG